MRKVMYKEKDDWTSVGSFHGFFNESFQKNGIRYSYIYALVENNNGEIIKKKPFNIRFLDESDDNQPIASKDQHLDKKMSVKYFILGEWIELSQKQIETLIANGKKYTLNINI